MQLPIDARNAPFKPKYLDEETPMFAGWFVFGREADGTVNIAAPHGDIFTGVTEEQAAALIAARDVFTLTVLRVLNDRGQTPEIMGQTAGQIVPNDPFRGHNKQTTETA